MNFKNGEFRLILFDNRNPSSISNYFRKKRVSSLIVFIKTQFTGETISILDLGGTSHFWNIFSPEFKNLNKKFEITIFNVSGFSDPSIADDGSQIQYFRSYGDARELTGYADRQFDLVFSNSVIEHVGTFEDQKKMADEIRRVGHFHFIQTPDPRFPIEPHFHFPFWVYLPESLKIWLLTHFSLGWYPKFESDTEALTEIRAINLIPLQKFRILFPDSEIKFERIFGFSKSFIAIGKGVT